MGEIAVLAAANVLSLDPERGGRGHFGVQEQGSRLEAAGVDGGSDSGLSATDAELLDEIAHAQRTAEPRYDDTLLPDGAIVAARFSGSVDVRKFRDRVKWYLRFIITEPDTSLVGWPLLYIYNEPTGDRIPRSHKLYRDWEDITGLKPTLLPRVKHKILDAMLKGCEVNARTRQVVEDSRGCRQVHKYSVIDGFGGRYEGRSCGPIAAGCPLIRQRRGAR